MALRTLVVRRTLGCLAISIGCILLFGIGERACRRESRHRDPPRTSPDGRYDVIYEHESFFLDVFSRLWIVPHGEEDEDHWHQITPWVDGAVDCDWISNEHLMLTNEGYFPTDWPVPRVESWRDVRIETRSPPSTSHLDAPGGRSELSIWTYQDSRGTRAAARLQTSLSREELQYGPASDEITLFEEGPWTVTGTWLSSEILELEFCPDPGVQVLANPTERWRGIEIRFLDPALSEK
jgi:hypothetical protein